MAREYDAFYKNGPFLTMLHNRPAGMLAVQLAYGMGLDPNVGMKLLRG
jgi:hypothetical protein